MTDVLQRTRRRRAVRMVGVIGAVCVAWRCNKSTPATPTPTPTPVTIAPPGAKAPTGGTEIVGLRPALEVNNSVVTGEVGAVTYRFEFSETSDFPGDSRTGSVSGVAQGGSTTTAQLPSDLQPGRLYYWHARATNGTVTSAYSTTASFKTENLGVKSGQNIWDPLTNGKSVADEVHGGHFVSGADGGWQVDNMTDSLDYNIPTCSNCRVEFDATNFDRSTAPEDYDMKWFSMGDGSEFNSFDLFRNSIWKMHIEKRSADGGAVKLIWRRGCNDSDPCDNTDNRKEPVAWTPSKVYHFTLTWGGGSMTVNVCEWNGSSCGSTVYSAGGSGTYAPPNHRLEIGTRPRGETLVGARFRNFKVTPQ